MGKLRTVNVRSRLLVARGLRGLADGFISVVLVHYLRDLGFSPSQIGVVVMATLLGSAALTLTSGLALNHLPHRTVLLAATALMAVTGVAFASFTEFWPLVVVALAGTLNPSANDVTLFLPNEQALLAQATEPRLHTSWYARVNVVAALAGAAGAVLSSIPQTTSAMRGSFLVYGAVAILVAGAYTGLPSEPRRPVRTRRPLAVSRRRVFELAALFSLDSAGGGFAVQALLIIYLERRFGLSTETMGAVLGTTTLLGGASQLLSAPLARRIGLVKTMSYTHLPANAFLVLAGIVPVAGWAVAFLFLRALFSSMDIPARQALVMAVVPPEERSAAASVTNVPRSLASATTPYLAGLLFELSPFGWPLVIGGVMKALYDVLLLLRWRSVATEVAD